MGARGRKSMESNALVGFRPSPVEITERQRPPPDLNDEEAGVWMAVVAAEPADWFNVATLPLLGQYCRHVVHCRRIAAMLERVTSNPGMELKDYDRLLRMQQRESLVASTLATKMRLTPQSMTNHRGHRRGSLARKPWDEDGS